MFLPYPISKPLYFLHNLPVIPMLKSLHLTLHRQDHNSDITHRVAVLTSSVCIYHRYYCVCSIRNKENNSVVLTRDAVERFARQFGVLSGNI